MAGAPILVGTCGWSYPTGRGTWNGVFYPPARPRGFDELAYYAARFETVEVNSTFYRMPEAPLVRGWLTRTPGTFTFAVKLYQKFTHPDLFLAHPGVASWDVGAADLDQFRAGIAPLAESGRLVAVLIQFPPSFHANPDTRGYLDWLAGSLADYPLAVELRHRSWMEAGADTRAQLGAHRAAWVLTDQPRAAGLPASVAPDESGLLYVRFHGRNELAWWEHDQSEDRYDYLYSPDELRPFAAIAREAAARGSRVAMYLNNHFSAKAVANAAILRHELGDLVPGEYPREMIYRYPALEGIVSTSGLPI